MDRDVKQNIAENAPIENPPEGGAGRDPLQDLSPEACTFEVFQQLNSKTGTLRVQAYAGQRTFPVPGASVLVTHDFADGTAITCSSPAIMANPPSSGIFLKNTS